MKKKCACGSEKQMQIKFVATLRSGTIMIWMRKNNEDLI